MSIQLNPYLSFRDNAREAMTFYQSVFGGQLDVSTFAEFGMTENPAERDLVMHSQLSTEEGLVFMGADTPSGTPFDEGSRITMTLSGDDEPVLRRYFDQLAEGGTVMMPLEKAPWGDYFGQCTDRYGVIWMVNISGEEEGS